MLVHVGKIEYRLVFILLFLSMYASKIGVIDISVISYTAISLSLIIRRKNLKLSSELLILILIGLFVLLYSIIMLLVTDSSESYVVFRNGRALLSIAILGIVFYNIKMPAKELLNMVIIATLLHSVAILLEMQSTPLKTYLAPIVGYNKELLPLRAFGLIGDYDSAGLLCIIGTVISFQLYFYTKLDRYLVASTIFITSAFFTSRFNMLIMVFVVFVFGTFWVTNKQSTLWSKIVILIGFIIMGYFVYMLVFPLLYATIPLLNENISISFSNSTQIYNTSYGTGSQAYLLDSMWRLPDEVIGIIFGTGLSPTDSDIGYVNIIFMIGIVGLLALLLFYAHMLKSLRQTIRYIYKINHEDIYLKVSIYSLIVIICALFIYNTKLLYLFTRTFHEMIIIIYFTIIANISELKYRSTSNVTQTSGFGRNI